MLTADGSTTCKTCQAELQRYKKLAGKVMQLLPKPLTLIFVNFEELVEFVRSRGSGGGTAFAGDAARGRPSATLLKA